MCKEATQAINTEAAKALASFPSETMFSSTIDVAIYGVTFCVEYYFCRKKYPDLIYSC